MDYIYLQICKDACMRKGELKDVTHLATLPNIFMGGIFGNQKNHKNNFPDLLCHTKQLLYIITVNCQQRRSHYPHKT